MEVAETDINPLSGVDVVVAVDFATTVLLAGTAVGLVRRALVEEPHGGSGLDGAEVLLGQLSEHVR